MESVPVACAQRSHLRNSCEARQESSQLLDEERLALRLASEFK
jgi:hypothetical protein